MSRTEGDRRFRLQPNHLRLSPQIRRRDEHHQVGDDDGAGEEIERRHQAEMVGDDAGADRAERLADAWVPNSMPMALPPMPGGVESRSQACSTARTANRKKPSSATKSTNHPVPPAKIMKPITTAVIDMLDMMIWRRPTLSEKWPAMGAATKPAACSANMQAPIQPIG